MKVRIVKIQEVNLEVYFDYYKGFAGTIEEPPEDPEYIIKYVFTAGQSLVVNNIVSLLSEEVLDEIEGKLEELRRSDTDE
jgi:nitrogen regulatory protein PII-like uncharacterized protein